MTNTQRPRKPVHSYRLSAEGIRQLKQLALSMERSESNVIEIALDRMYREEVRFGQSRILERTGSYMAVTIEEPKEKK